MKTGKITNHPFAIPLFPVKRGSPMLLIHFLPAGGMPPTKILITACMDEFKIVTVTDGRAIDREVMEEDLMRRLFVVEREVERPHPCGRFAGIPAGAKTKFKQSSLNLHHPAHAFNRERRRRDCRIKLIAKQVLDVINQ